VVCSWAAVHEKNRKTLTLLTHEQIDFSGRKIYYATPHAIPFALSLAFTCLVSFLENLFCCRHTV